MDETSLEIVNAGEMYPKQSFTSDDGVLTVPFPLLSGEGPIFRGRSAEGVVVVTSYRLYQSEGTYINVPLGLVDYIECRDILYLFIYCKDGRFYRCVFDSAEDAQKWAKRLQSRIQLPQKIDTCFAFRFLSWTREEQKDNIVSQSPSNIGDVSIDGAYAEAERMGFDLKTVWKISTINENYELCPSYPRRIITPSMLLDEEMRDLANFRYSNRIPAVVWRHQQNGCVIARSSQPRQGVWCWRNLYDEKLLDAISAACVMDPGYGERMDEKEDAIIKSDMDSDISILYGQSNKPLRKKLLIVDARSYAAAVTNRAKGGGYECDGYYPNCEVQYMGLANIHTIRNSFASLRALCVANDDLSWLSALEGTKWLLHISGLIRAALLVVDAVDVERRPVLVHCSDGWDRTPQIVALAEIMLDPYYRTKKGFQTLVEREWLEFGHKFADRCGHADGVEDRNERSPVFLQWLDCVFQLMQQFQCHFEFNEQYLVRLVLHTYSGLFGTFLCNTDYDRRHTYSIYHRTFSVWPVLNEKNHFHNYLYNHSTEVLRPSFQMRNLKFWSDVYFPSNSANLGRSTIPPDEQLTPDFKPPAGSEKTNLVKTKSCDNIHSQDHSLTLQRRRSDPNLGENNFNDGTVESSFVDPVDKTDFTDSVSFPLEIVVPSAPSADKIYSEEDGIVTKVANDIVANATNGGVTNATNGVVTANVNGIFNCETDNAKGEQIDSIESCLTKNCFTDGNKTNVVDINEDLNPEARDGLYFAACDSDGERTVSAKVAIDGSTDTLVSENDVVVRSHRDGRSKKSSVSTDTNDLVPEQNGVADNGLPNWCQSVIGAYIYHKRNGSNSWSCSYTTPNHSRTPSSGFPATPCDDPCEMPNLKRDSPSQLMDFDGLDIQSDFVQERIKKIILHYKNKVGNLNLELHNTREEFIQHIYRCSQGKDARFVDTEDTPSLADSASSGEPPLESNGSESSWDLVWSPDQGAAANHGTM